MVRLTVPGATLPTPTLFARGCVEGRDTGEVRSRGFVADPFRIVAGRDQQDRSRVDTNTMTREQRGRGPRDELAEHDIQVVHVVLDGP